MSTTLRFTSSSSVDIFLFKCVIVSQEFIFYESCNPTMFSSSTLWNFEVEEGFS